MTFWKTDTKRTVKLPIMKAQWTFRAKVKWEIIQEFLLKRQVKLGKYCADSLIFRIEEFDGNRLNLKYFMSRF